MRLLGPKASLAVFRWDLIYLIAQLVADERPGVADLAPPLKSLLQEIGDGRAALEQMEDEEVVATALVHKRDKRRDKLVIEMGGVARASYKAVYATLFPKLNPSQTARIGVDAESAEVKRILGELAALGPGHALQVAYQTTLTDAEMQVRDAVTQADQAATALALERSKVERLKLSIDKERLSAHGKLTALLHDKDEVEAFFRPASEEKKAGEPAAPPADQALPAGSTP